MALESEETADPSLLLGMTGSLGLGEADPSLLLGMTVTIFSSL